MSTKQITPAELIAAPSLFGNPREHSKGVRCVRGFDGGYDDGYDWMHAMTDSGWKLLPAVGDWPYVAYLRWPPTRDGEGTVLDGGAIVERVEGDLALFLFDDLESANRFYSELPRN